MGEEPKFYNATMDLILALALIAGQLIKLPILSNGAMTVLDLTVAGYLLLAVIRRKISLPGSKTPGFFWFGLLFSATALIALVFTPLRLSLDQVFLSAAYLARFLIYLAFGLVVCQKAFPKLNKNLERVFVISGLGLSVLGLFQLTFFPDLQFLAVVGWDPHYFRLVSTFLDPNFLGSFLTLSLITLVNQFKNMTQKYAVLWFCVIFLALLLTFSRSAYITFLVAFAALSLLKRSPKLALVTMILTPILITGFFFYQKIIAEPRSVDRLASASNRLNSLDQGSQIFLRSPLFGVGFNSYRYALGQYRLASAEQIKSHGGSSNDISLLFVLATTGTVGLTAYLMFIGAISKTGWSNLKNSPDYGLTLTAGLPAILAGSLAINTLFYPPILLWIISFSALNSSGD